MKKIFIGGIIVFLCFIGLVYSSMHQTQEQIVEGFIKGFYHTSQQDSKDLEESSKLLDKQLEYFNEEEKKNISHAKGLYLDIADYVNNEGAMSYLNRAMWAKKIKYVEWGILSIEVQHLELELFDKDVYEYHGTVLVTHQEEKDRSFPITGKVRLTKEGSKWKVFSFDEPGNDNLYAKLLINYN